LSNENNKTDLTDDHSLSGIHFNQAPALVVIGGGMAALGDVLIAPGRRMVAERAFSVSSGTVRIVTAALGNEAGVYGAAAFVFDRLARRKNE